MEDKLKPEHRVFAESYIYDWNATRAYKVAYPKASDETARVNASRLLTNANIQAYIKDIQEDLEKIAGISRLRIAQEHLKIVNTSIAQLHNTWIERKEFDKLTDDQKSSIQEISTQIKVNKNSDGTLEENEYIKIKLYDRQKSMDALTKLFGWEAAEKLEITGNVKSYTIRGAGPKRAGDNS